MAPLTVAHRNETQRTWPSPRRSAAANPRRVPTPLRLRLSVAGPPANPTSEARGEMFMQPPSRVQEAETFGCDARVVAQRTAPTPTIAGRCRHCGSYQQDLVGHLDAERANERRLFLLHDRSDPSRISRERATERRCKPDDEIDRCFCYPAERRYRYRHRERTRPDAADGRSVSELPHDALS